MADNFFSKVDWHVMAPFIVKGTFFRSEAEFALQGVKFNHKSTWPKKSFTALRYFGHCSANRGRNDVLVCLPGRDVKRPLFGLALKKMARKWQKRSALFSDSCWEVGWIMLGFTKSCNLFASLWKRENRAYLRHISPPFSSPHLLLCSFHLISATTTINICPGPSVRPSGSCTGRRAVEGSDPV